MNNKFKKTVAAFMTASLALSPVFTFVSVNAKEKTTSLEKITAEKEEVVYANLNGDGTVEKVYVVNIFDRQEDGKIIDYGDYSEVRNMNTTDHIFKNEDEVSIDAKVGKIYYEGALKNKTLPWNIEIHYYIDGTEYSEKEIAGKSGQLKITISIKKNQAMEEKFCNNYGLQTSLTLDGKNCENIQTTKATVANVGENKQLTYTVLPGKEREIIVTADVKDFEMDAITINGVSMALDIDASSIEKGNMDQKIKDLQEAVVDVDDGAKELKDGSNELKDGVQDANSGAGKLKDGVNKLNNGGKDLSTGVESLEEGIKEMEAAVSTLASKSSSLTKGSKQVKSALAKIKKALNNVKASSSDLKKLAASSTQIKSGIVSLVTGLETMSSSIDTYNAELKKNGLSASSLISNNKEMITMLNGQITALNKSLSSATDAQKASINSQINLYKKMIQLLTGNSGVLSADKQLINGFDSALDASNKKGIMYGAKQLKEKYTGFDTAIQEMVTSLGNTMTNLVTLKNAINTLNTQYTALNSGIIEYTGGVNKINASFSKITAGTSTLVRGTQDLYKGTQSLYKGTSDLYEGTQKLQEGSTALYDGTRELYNGTKKFVDETKDLDQEVDDEIDDMIKSFTNSDFQVVSFVSDKNTNVDTVQFVIRTNKIEIPEEEVETAVEEQSAGFWNKLVQLFK